MLKRLIGDKASLENVVTLLTGSVLAQVITVLVTPVLTRIFTTEDFGILAAFTAVTSFIAFISSFRYELAIMLPKADKEANELFQLAIRIVLIVSIVSGILLYIFGDVLCDWLQVPQLKSYILFMPVAILLTGLYQVIMNWNNRFESYKRISASRLSQSISTASTNVGLGVANFGFISLIIGQLVGLFISVLVMFHKWKKGVEHKLFSVSNAELKELAKEYKEFPMYNAPHILSNQLQNNGVIFFVSGFFGAAILGLYSLTLRVLHAPLNTIGISYTQVFYKNASVLYANGKNLKAFTKKSILQLTAMSIPVFIVLLFFAPDLFAFIFGEEWREAGDYARYLSPWLLITFIIKPISTIPVIVNEQKKSFIINLIGNSLILLCIVVGGILLKDVKSTFLILSATQILYQSAYIAWIVSISNKKNEEVQP
ncbi:MAG: oligosaccharide flippase family protein [Bacteroidia bacterium]|nr:oligosaccharide flippase family protein [Bacteroidia bacterium]